MHLSRLKPYYDRKTLLLGSDHKPVTSNFSDENSATLGRALTFEAGNTAPEKSVNSAESTTNNHKFASAPPHPLSTPTPNQITTSSEILDSILHTRANHSEPLPQPLVHGTHMADNNVHRTTWQG